MEDFCIADLIQIVCFTLSCLSLLQDFVFDIAPLTSAGRTVLLHNPP